MIPTQSKYFLSTNIQMSKECEEIYVNQFLFSLKLEVDNFFVYLKIKK